jgi:carbon monoxide dehydrogenase subunit G
MELTENKIIKTRKKAVWRALMSADVLSKCIPGCKDMLGNPQDGFEATVVQKVGPVKATFKGKVTLSDVISEESLKLNGEGKGGAAGFAKGEATVKLIEENNSTILSYSVSAKVGGKLAQLGSRIIDGFAKKMADQFFENFKATVEESVFPGDEKKVD